MNTSSLSSPPREDSIKFNTLSKQSKLVDSLLLELEAEIQLSSSAKRKFLYNPYPI